jgi:hypothetical protein
LDEKWDPKFTLIVAQKNHHTKFFIPGVPDNVPPGNPFISAMCCCKANFYEKLLRISKNELLSKTISGCRYCCGQQSLPSKEL